MKALRGTAIIGVLLLAGCAQAGLPEADYFEILRETPGLAGLTDQNIRDNGKAICDVFATTEDPYVSALGVLLDAGMDAGDAGALIALSVSQYCPESIDLIPTL